jgi:hypothetical protein
MKDRSFNKLVQLLETVESFRTNEKTDDHPDHEVHMARSQVAEIIANAIKIQDMLETQDLSEDLEAWIQSKLTLADDYLISVRSSMEQGFRDEDGVESDAMPIKVVKIKLEPKG